MSDKQKKICETCKKNKQELCLGRKEICGEYRAVPIISQTERDLWPKYMQGGYASQSK